MSWGGLVFRSLSGRPRTLLIALLAAGVAALLTTGSILVGSIYEGTRSSIIESGAGHLQVYNADSASTPTVVPGPGGAPELLPIPDFPKVGALLRGIPGVREVVPMELGMAETFRGNYLDERLQALRSILAEPASPRRDAALERMTADLRRALQEIARDGRQRDALFATGTIAQEDQRALETAASDDLWRRFHAEPYAVLEFIENNVSKQLGEGEAIPLDLIGTDIATFARAFPRVEVVHGGLPPPGQRGLLIGQAVYEQSFKLPIAQRLDEVSRARAGGGEIARDERLRALLDRNLEELPYLLLELDPERAEALKAALARVLGREGALEPLLREFLTLDDASFDERYRLFYAELAPRLPLYRLAPGESLTLRSLNNDTTLKLRVYGVFRFRGLGTEYDRVNSVNLIDPVAAQLLARRQTRAQAQEAQRVIATLDLPEIPADGEGLRPPEVVEAEAAEPSPEPVIEAAGLADTFTKEDVEAGGVVQAAVLLAPGVEPEEVAAEIASRARDRGLRIATVGWLEVGGLVAQVVSLSRTMLLFASLVLGLIVLLVSAGTLVLMASERVGEVGTMRAIGMQRGEVFTLMLLEGLVLGVLGATVGAGAAILLMKGMVGQGIAITDGMLQFLLGGPLLVPSLEPGPILLMVVGVVVEVVLASLWPAWYGSSVPPRVVMGRGSDL